MPVVQNDGILITRGFILSARRPERASAVGVARLAVAALGHYSPGPSGL